MTRGRTCPHCDGDGRVEHPAWAQHRADVEAGRRDPDLVDYLEGIEAEMVCPFCFGKGVIRPAEGDLNMPDLDEEEPGAGPGVPDVLEIARAGAADASRRASRIMQQARAEGRFDHTADLAQTVMGLARTVIGLCGVVAELRDVDRP